MPKRILTAPPTGAAWLADIRGGLRLANDGVQGVTHIAETLHERIASVAPPIGTRPERRARGIAGFVYGAVRGTSALAARGADAALAGVEALLPQADETAAAATPRRDALVSALNGVAGDHLGRTGNPLAIRMQLLPAAAPAPRVLLLVHGLCMNERQWTRNGHDHGKALAAALGVAPVYLRYNSGLHVSTNGKELAQLLEDFLAQWPAGIASLDILGHSMGGLVARSAVHYAQEAKLHWPSRLRRMVFLGTPQHGAALERGGNWLHRGLGISPYLAPFTRLSGLRSEGITDLRHGNLLDIDWQGGRFQQRDSRVPVPLPEGVSCFAVAGTLGKRGLADATVGDGLVTPASAFGRHEEPARDLKLPRSHVYTARGVNHLGLLSDPAVCRRLMGWLQAP